MSKSSRKRQDPDKVLTYNGTMFQCRYDHPARNRHTALPLRIRMTPYTPDGKPVTKAMMGNSDSTRNLEKTTRAKSKKHFREEVFAVEAAKILLQMREAGLLPESDTANTEDLATLLEEIREAIFVLHQKDWGPTTRKDYAGQYKILQEEVARINPLELSNDVYKSLQESICRNASVGSKSLRPWNEGDAPPPSAAKRIYLLRLAIRYLQQQEGLAIPCDPARYFGRKNRTDELLDLLENAHLFPQECLDDLVQSLPAAFDLLPILLAIQLDTGLRISEVLGLLWADLYRITGSQDPLYYLRVTGQLSTTGKRISTPKTVNAYRTLPLARRVGQLLWAERDRLQAQRKNIDRFTIIGTGNGSDPQEDNASHLAQKNAYLQYLDAMFTQIRLFERVRAVRPYRFDENRQDEALRDSLTSHSLRRNFCSRLYAGSGIEPLEIFHQMGHDPSAILPKKTISLGGAKTDTELYCMCLFHESNTLYAEPSTLHYTVEKDGLRADIPACRIALTVAPGQKLSLEVQDTQPGNLLTVQPDEGLSCQLIHHTTTSVTPVRLPPVSLPAAPGQYIHPEDYLPPADAPKDPVGKPP